MLESADRWLAIRQIRNQMIHEYIESAQVLADALNAAHDYQEKIIRESLNNHLKRRQLGVTATGDQEIDALVPLSPQDVRAYVMENSAKHSLMDEQSNLVDDTLLQHFNAINVVYDRMRDIEWNRMK
jgi:hypothetical protein